MYIINLNNFEKIYGLIGYPLSHSFSQKYFREKFKIENIQGVDYLNFQIDNIESIRSVLTENPLLQGFNVTIPYKEKILHYLDEIDPDALKIGAVNTVKCTKTSKGFHLKGYNTDFYGFTQSLKPFLSGEESKALVLGNGGAAKAIIYSLEKLNIQALIVSRKKTDNISFLTYSQLSEALFKQIDLIVNTTPVGMWPNIKDCPPLPYSCINKNILAYDLIYNPERTLFLNEAEKYGARITNGMEMLKLQAEKAWEIFNSI